jgi:Domain of unknown function (DUF4124)
MHSASMIRGVLAVVAAVAALSPTSALAQRMHGAVGMSSGQGSGHFVSGSRSHFRFHNGFGHRGVIFIAPPIGYGDDPYDYPSATYDPSVSYGGPTYGTAAAPPAQPMAVYYPTGRYEMRGDGYSTPYQWIWIPNPPSGPPPSAPPPAGPSSSFQPEPPALPASSKPEPPGNTTVYRWTDTDGVLHFTDRLDTVPARYRAQAKSSRPS